MVFGKLKERRKRIKSERMTRKFISSQLPKKSFKERAAAQKAKAKEQAGVVKGNIKKLSGGRIAAPGSRVRVRKALIKSARRKKKRKTIFDQPIGEGFFE